MCRQQLCAVPIAILFCGCSAGLPNSPQTVDPSSHPTAVTSEGLVTGIAIDEVNEFLGVPYAAPPVGPARWKAPGPPANYPTGKYDASYPRSDCTQGSASESHGNEDCLYLNIYEPRFAGVAIRKAPVIVWIHGGGYSGGSGIQYNLGPLASSQRSVAVSINYRLGVFGFLAHPALSAEENPPRSGNYGIMDMQSALKWVRRNIGAFGGDPQNVTVVGQSAGGNAIYVLLASPLSKGLFQKAAPLSGAFFRNQPTVDYASRLEDPRTQEANGLEIAKAYGCGNSSAGSVDFAAVASCLRDRPASSLLGQSYIEPVIDGKILVESTAAAFAAGRFNRVPVMAGFTQDEGTIFVVSLSHQVDASNYASRLDLGGVSSGVPSRYPLTDYPTPLQALAKAVGDYMFACSALQDMDAISRYVPQSYVYQFADQTPASTDAFAKNYPPSIPGTLEALAAHGTDITYWLGLLQPRDAAPARVNLSRAMMRYLGNFALHGNPNAVGAPRWLPFERANRRVNILGYPITLAADVFASHQCAFWYSATTVEGVWSK